ncbi:zinc-binding metallopeptidase family protein [Granulibacter bethesdensis]|uniref:zinc-binding metallopeptidase family protein n=1 Tax=Granulibacter bethesdensis TaxID=364410 RepID=UPI0003F212FB|nr:putative zinc-binding peptidase [Granulibacter bethesdensis]AHJ68769.1 putative cytosolic protein [Granulibacter bethesdensis]
MKLFNCDHCGNLLYFENRECGKCGHRLGYIPQTASLSALEPMEPEEDGTAVFHAMADGGTYRFCDNVVNDGCNWLVPTGSADRFCLACRHNRTIPDLSIPGNLEKWQKLELAKHRLFYTLIQLGLPLPTVQEHPEGLVFDFKDDTPEEPVLTGHDNGVITIALKEADDAERAKMQQEMGEQYRTLIGHFRHEVGHFFWDRLVRDGDRLEECRAVFGDERLDYQQALQNRYENGPPVGWEENFISAYASVHPWEDFAETWAHYLHIVDTLETANAFGLQVRAKADASGEMATKIDFGPHEVDRIEDLITAWVPLTVAVNSLNRSMGEADLYPFVLNSAVEAKLAFLHTLIHDHRHAVVQAEPQAA